MNFDGIDYFAKVWLNGIELGKHRGIFGGPVIDVSENLNYGGDNELIVEVISANYGKTSFNPNRPGNIVKGWFLMEEVQWNLFQFRLMEKRSSGIRS